MTAKRYQVFLENSDGSGQGSLHDVDSLDLAWSWFDLTFGNDAPARLWWIKDRKAEKVVSGMQTASQWLHEFDGPDDFKAIFKYRHQWE